MSRPLSGCTLSRVLQRTAAVEVYLAHLDGIEGPVVLKRAVDPTDEAVIVRLRAEVDRAIEVAHPDLLRPLGTIEDPPGVALVLPYIPGGSLRGLLDAHGALTAGQVSALVDPVADVLDALGAAGVAHGDLSPANVLLRADGSPVVADPGTLGRATPAYLDPAATGPPTPLGDVYSLSVIAYEALSGRCPHRGSPAETMALAAAGAHRSLTTWPGVPAPVAEVVERAISVDRRRRPPSAGAFAAMLRSVIDPTEVGLLAPPAEAVSAPGRPGGGTLEFVSGPAGGVGAPESRRRGFRRRRPPSAGRAHQRGSAATNSANRSNGNGLENR